MILGTMKQSDEASYDRMDADLFHSNKMSSSSPRFQTVAVVLIGVVAAIALVFSAIALARPGTMGITVPVQDTAGNTDSKIWVFAIGHDGSELEYIHELSGTVRGFHVDLVEAVCARANKNCRMMWDVYENCYRSKVGERSRPGVGLVSGWYDGCTGWFNTYERAVSVSFTKPFRKPQESVFFVRRGNPGNFMANDLTGKTIGFIDGFSSNEHCLKRTKVTGGDLPPDRTKHFMSSESAVQAVNNQEVDAVFANIYSLDLAEHLDIASGDTISSCSGDGAGIMIRKDSRLADWWNPAFDQLKMSNEFQRICSEVSAKHGDQLLAQKPDYCVA
ncbi:arginine-binding periplasmic protein-like [Asterias amurensis]|uniref:arginine-binding periplasmic protein-like n=1 Tax=Asterias amurensis TaxID=7602 RepID=UPI003AB4C0FA